MIPKNLYVVIVDGRFSRFRIWTSCKEAQNYRRKQVDMWIYKDPNHAKRFQDAIIRSYAINPIKPLGRYKKNE